MVVVALMAAVLGGYYFAFLVAAAATGMFYEWMRIVRGWGLHWSVGGFFYCLLPALALLWIRDRSGDQGLSLLLWVFVVTWSTDIGA
jgi:phosphatidate cytidylyltransferase